MSLFSSSVSFRSALSCRCPQRYGKMLSHVCKLGSTVIEDGRIYSSDETSTGFGIMKFVVEM